MRREKERNELARNHKVRRNAREKREVWCEKRHKALWYLLVFIYLQPPRAKPEANSERFPFDSKKRTFSPEKDGYGRKLSFSAFYEKVFKQTNILFLDYLGLLSLSLTPKKNCKHSAVG